MLVKLAIPCLALPGEPVTNYEYLGGLATYQGINISQLAVAYHGGKLPPEVAKMLASPELKLPAN